MQAQLRQNSGFNLIEMLIAMAVLMTIVAVACTMLSETDAAWLMGTGRAKNASSGRAALAMLSRDLQQAAADGQLTFRILTAPGTSSAFCSESYGFTNDVIEFVSLQNDSSDTNRTARLIRYWIRDDTNSTHQRFELVRACTPAPLATNDPANCYWFTNWHETAVNEADTGVLARNVAAFALDWPDRSTDAYLSTEHTNRLPEYVDIFLELLDDRAALKAAQLPSPRWEEFVEQNAIRYATRVFLPNRQLKRP